MESKESNAESYKMKFDVFNVNKPNCASEEILLMFCDIFNKPYSDCKHQPHYAFILPQFDVNGKST